jgi:AraC-like DNA-binding protein
MVTDEVWDKVTQQNSLLFVIEGAMLITVGYLKTKEIKKGFFTFVSPNESIHTYAKTNMVLVIVHIDSLAGLCENLKMEQLYQSQKEDVSDSYDEELYSSLIQPSLWHFLNGVYTAILDGIKCNTYFDAKVSELYLLLRVYYTKRELFMIFYPVLTNDIAFSDVVKSSWQKYKTIDDLAEAMRLTPSSFYRHFLKTFGCSAHQWITEQKKLMVYKDLISNNINFKELADKYWFSSVSSFNNWCVKVYGSSPGDMRKKLYNRRI